MGLAYSRVMDLNQIMVFKYCCPFLYLLFINTKIFCYIRYAYFSLLLCKFIKHIKDLGPSPVVEGV